VDRSAAALTGGMPLWRPSLQPCNRFVSIEQSSRRPVGVKRRNAGIAGGDAYCEQAEGLFAKEAPHAHLDPPRG